MSSQPQYGTTAKVFHWLIVALLLVQYPIGWFMPDIHRGMEPGAPMVWHISIGFTILVLIVLRFLWRVTHPVAPDSSLPRWQRVGAEALHWLLYILVFITTMSGWLFASMRGWSISLFFTVPLPMLTEQGAPIARALGRWHSNLQLALVILIGFHVAAALAHLFIHRDRVMHRMLRSN
jgi:cytochrome b561